MSVGLYTNCSALVSIKIIQKQAMQTDELWFERTHACKSGSDCNPDYVQRQKFQKICCQYAFEYTDKIKQDGNVQTLTLTITPNTKNHRVQKSVYDCINIRQQRLTDGTK